MKKLFLFGIIMLSLCSFAYECEFKLNDKTINYDADELKFYEITDTAKTENSILKIHYLNQKKCLF